MTTTNKARSEWNEMDYAINHMVLQYTEKRVSLRQRAEYIRDGMTRLMTRLDEEDDMTSSYTGFNSLGELQGSGMDLDRLCGEVATLKDALVTINYARKHMAEGEAKELTK